MRFRSVMPTAEDDRLELHFDIMVHAHFVNPQLPQGDEGCLVGLSCRVARRGIAW